jgi:hypothetical protein
MIRCDPYNPMDLSKISAQRYEICFFYLSIKYQGATGYFSSPAGILIAS